MFSFLKKNKVPAFSDKVWRSRDIAWKEMATETLRILQRGETPIVAVFFSETLHHVEDYFISLKVPCKRLAEGQAMENNVVYTADAFSLMSASMLAVMIQRAPVARASILFLGHYPLPARENEVLIKISETLQQQVSLTFWLSFDDPLLKKFGGDKVLPLLDKLGFKEDECVEHSLVSKSITNAREKIAKRVLHEITSSSEEAWFEKNLAQ